MQRSPVPGWAPLLFPCNTRLLWTQLCPVVDSVLSVVNELLGAVLSKLGPNPLLGPFYPLPLPQRVAVPGREEGTGFWGLPLPPQADEAATLRSPHGGVG